MLKKGELLEGKIELQKFIRRYYRKDEDHFMAGKVIMAIDQRMSMGTCRLQVESTAGLPVQGIHPSARAPAPSAPAGTVQFSDTSPDNRSPADCQTARRKPSRSVPKQFTSLPL
jgi:hypothetical protein